MLLWFWPRLPDPSGKRFFYRPSMVQSPAEQRRPKTDLSRPFSNIHGDAIERDWPIGGSVIALLLGRGPAAVFRAVIALTIDSVKAGSFRPFAHVGKEVLKIKPSFTDLNPFSSIARIVGRCWAEASSFHRIPRNEGRRLITLSTVTVLCIYFDFVATARFDCARTKRLCGDDFSCAAVTNAVPEGSSSSLFVGQAFNEQPGKPLSGQVDMTTHGFTSIRVSNHLKARNSGVIEVPFSAAKPSYAYGV